MDRFKKQGVPGMSPLIIPTLSLHAVAGSLEPGLEDHGFNYGVGGGHGHLAEALLTALAARDDDGVPGVWVVATQFSPEPVPDTVGNSLNVSLRLRRGSGALGRRRGELPAELRGWCRPSAQASRGTTATWPASEPPSSLVALAEFLARLGDLPRPRRWYCPLARRRSDRARRRPRPRRAVGDRASRGRVV